MGAEWDPPGIWPLRLLLPAPAWNAWGGGMSASFAYKAPPPGEAGESRGKNGPRYSGHSPLRSQCGLTLRCMDGSLLPGPKAHPWLQGTRLNQACHPPGARHCI